MFESRYDQSLFQPAMKKFGNLPQIMETPTEMKKLRIEGWAFWKELLFWWE